MADLTDEMKEFLNSNLAWVATISKEGQIDLGPKMSTFIIDSSHIGYHERTAGQTYRNLLDGSDLVVAVAPILNRRKATVSAATSYSIPTMRSMTSRSRSPRNEARKSR